MRRIVSDENCVVVVSYNVSKNHCNFRIYRNSFPERVEICDFYPCSRRDFVRSIEMDTDRDFLKEVLTDNRSYVFRVTRNPYFSMKTGKPLSAWYSLP